MAKSFGRKPARRTCLRCTRRFLSDGPGHRFCASCRRSLDAAPPLGRLAGPGSRIHTTVCLDDTDL